MENQYKALLLISSGIDSPVAGYSALKRGIQIDVIHFSNNRNDDTNNISLEKVKKLVRRLNELNPTKNTIKLIKAEHFTSQQAFKEKCNNKYQCVFCKRMMVRVAGKYAEKNGYDFLIMGDNLAQVASQTLENLAITSSITNTPILRPLVTYDKNDIIRIAEDIETFEISKEKESRCPFLPSSPVTKARDYQIKKEEAKVDIDSITEESLKSIKIVEIQ